MARMGPLVSESVARLGTGMVLKVLRWNVNMAPAPSCAVAWQRPPVTRRVAHAARGRGDAAAAALAALILRLPAHAVRDAAAAVPRRRTLLRAGQPW